MRKFITAISLLALLLEAASCAREDRADDTHVVLLGFDGWGAYCMPKADMPTVKWMMENGAYTLKKRSVLPTVSGLNWASMFMGATPEVHGYTTFYSKTPEIPPYTVHEHNIFPTISQILRQQRPDAEIGCIYEWSGIKYVVDTLACSYVEQSHDTVSVNNKTCQLAEQYIKQKKPTLLTVAFDEPDATAHRLGHDKPEYYQKVHELDGYIARIVQATKDAGIYDNTIFVLSADHGGIHSWHGGKELVELETPFVICGKGIKKTGEFSELMMQYDTAPTIARALGLTTPQEWNGRPMTQVFE